MLSTDGSTVVVSAAGRLQGYDLGSGRQRWSLSGVRGNYIASPAVAEDLVLVASRTAGSNFALRVDEEGELGAHHVVWKVDGDSGYASPLAYGNSGIWVENGGLVRSVGLATGEERWRYRLGASLWATPIANGDHLYFFSKNGETTVLRDSDDAPQVIALNRLQLEHDLYGVGAVDGYLLLRAGKELIAIRADDRTRPIDSELDGDG